MFIFSTGMLSNTSMLTLPPTGKFKTCSLYIKKSVFKVSITLNKMLNAMELYA